MSRKGSCIGKLCCWFKRCVSLCLALVRSIGLKVPYMMLLGFDRCLVPGEGERV